MPLEAAEGGASADAEPVEAKEQTPAKTRFQRAVHQPRSILNFTVTVTVTVCRSFLMALRISLS